VADFALLPDLPAKTCGQTSCFTLLSFFFPPFLYQVGNRLAERALPRHADSPRFHASKLPSPEQGDGESLSIQEGPSVHNSEGRKLETGANTHAALNLACLADS